MFTPGDLLIRKKKKDLVTSSDVPAGRHMGIQYIVRIDPNGLNTENWQDSRHYYINSKTEDYSMGWWLAEHFNVATPAEIVKIRQQGKLEWLKKKWLNKVGETNTFK